MSKFISFFLLSLLVSIPVAHSAQVFTLQYINTNNCERARGLVMMLNSADAIVEPVCSEYRPQGYKSDNGRFYDYRLYTTVTLLGNEGTGSRVQLSNINLNNCEGPRGELMLLNSAQMQVEAVCSPYAPQGYASRNGKLYDYRLYTYVTVK